MVRWAFSEAGWLILALLIVVIAFSIIFALNVPLPDFAQTFTTSLSATVRGAVYGSPVTHKLTRQGWIPETLPLLGRIRGAWRIDFSAAEKQDVTTLHSCWWDNEENKCRPVFQDWANEEFCSGLSEFDDAGDEECDFLNETAISPWKLLQTAVAQEAETCWGMYGNKKDPLFPGGYGSNPKICSILEYDLRNSFDDSGAPSPATDINGLPGLFEGRWLNEETGIIEYYTVEDLLHWITISNVSGKPFPEVVPEITSMGYGNWICGSRSGTEEMATKDFCNNYNDYMPLISGSSPSCEQCMWTGENCVPNMREDAEISEERLEEWNAFCNTSDTIKEATNLQKGRDCVAKTDSVCGVKDEKCTTKEKIVKGDVQCPLDCRIIHGSYCSDQYLRGTKFVEEDTGGNCIYTQYSGLEGAQRPPLVNRNVLCSCTVESNMDLIKLQTESSPSDAIVVPAPLTKGRIFVTFLDMWSNEDWLFDTNPIKFGNSVCGVVEVEAWWPALKKNDKVLLCIQDESWIDGNMWGRPVDQNDPNKGKYGLILTNTGGEGPGGLGCMMQCENWERGGDMPKIVDCGIITVGESVIQFFESAGTKWAETFEKNPYCVLALAVGCFFL
jgi:hypothetical protein